MVADQEEVEDMNATRWGGGKLARRLLLLIFAGLAASQLRSFAGSQTPSPHRIVSLIPSVTEMLFAIGAGDAVVGVSSFDHYPPAVERKTRVGGLLDPDFERILALKPDLVIVYGTQGALIERLTRAQVPLFNYEHAGLADVTRTLRQIGERVGRGDPAKRAADDIERRLADLRAKTGQRPKPRTMVVFEREPGTLRGMYASGGIGFLHDMLIVAGGVNVFADVPRQSMQVTAEQVLSRAPEVILEIHSGPQWTADRIAREREPWRALASVPAIRSGRIHLLTDEMMSIPGPRVADAALVMAKALHADLFK
jgi:iron complex transport system substrate-binding protein